MEMTMEFRQTEAAIFLREAIQEAATVYRKSNRQAQHGSRRVKEAGTRHMRGT